MKTRILLLSIAMLSFTAFSFAADAPNISKNVKSSFNMQFSDAREIQWENKTEFIKASFIQNGMALYAYFNRNGELLALTRFISPDHLPLELLYTLKSQNPDCWISDLFEIHTESGTSYYATLENANRVKVVKSEGTNGWQTYKIIQKAHDE